MLLEGFTCLVGKWRAFLDPEVLLVEEMIPWILVAVRHVCLGKANSAAENFVNVACACSRRPCPIRFQDFMRLPAGNSTELRLRIRIWDAPREWLHNSQWMNEWMNNCLGRGSPFINIKNNNATYYHNNNCLCFIHTNTNWASCWTIHLQI